MDEARERQAGGSRTGVGSNAEMTARHVRELVRADARAHGALRAPTSRAR